MTIKYDTDGNEIWVARYGDGICAATSLAVGVSGDVYVTGSCSGIEVDYVTVKYNGEGSELWVARYNGPGNGDDLALDLALTEAGEGYVTGQSLGDDTWADMATVKYSSGGTQLWVARYNLFLDTWEGGVAVGADDEGNAYITAKARGIVGGKDYVTIKYNPIGGTVRSARCDRTWQDIPVGLASGPANSIFVTGTVDGMRGGNDILTVKYVDTGDGSAWGVASSAIPTITASRTVRPAGVFVHLLLIFGPLLAATIWLRLRHDRSCRRQPAPPGRGTSA